MENVIQGSEGLHTPFISTSRAKLRSISGCSGASIPASFTEFLFQILRPRSQGLLHFPHNPGVLSDRGMEILSHFSLRAGLPVPLPHKGRRAPRPDRGSAGCPPRASPPAPPAGRPCMATQASLRPPGRLVPTPGATPRCANSSGKDHFKSPFKPDL